MPVFEKYKRRNESAFLSQTEEEDRRGGIGYSRKLDITRDSYSTITNHTSQISDPSFWNLKATDKYADVIKMMIKLGHH